MEHLSNTEAVLFSLNAFQARGRRYVLKQPAECCRAFEEGYYVFECPEHDISGYSRSKEEAFADLNADFACRYDGLVNEPDAALSLDAREMRDHLRRSVLRVEPERTLAEAASAAT